MTKKEEIKKIIESFTEEQLKDLLLHLLWEDDPLYCKITEGLPKEFLDEIEKIHHKKLIDFVYE